MSFDTRGLTLATLCLFGCQPGEKGGPDEDSLAATDTAAPVTDTGDEKVTDTGVEPVTDTGVEPVTDTGVEPTDTGIEPTDTGEQDTDPQTDTGEIDEACQLGAEPAAPYFTINTQGLDEACTVVGVESNNEGLLLALDCPLFAAANDGEKVMLQISGAPLPPTLQLGDALTVYHQAGDFEGFFDHGSPELLFLRRDGELYYASIRGYFITDEDFQLAKDGVLPFTVELVEGACPPIATGWEGGDGLNCKFEAIAGLKVAADGEALLGAGQTEVLKAGVRDYTVDVREAYHGTDCVDMDVLIHYTMAIALSQ